MKKNLVNVILNYKCPKCHEGNMFVKPFKFNDPLNMHKNCDQCGLSFEQEPGFYYGAMFISYGITVLLMLLSAGILIVGFGLSPNLSMILMILLIGILFFKVLRGARAIWLGMTIKYNPNAIADFNEK